MKLTFLGTRGEIDVRTKRHRMHTSLLITYKNKNVMIDRGLDWLNKEYNLNLTAIVITHAQGTDQLVRKRKSFPGNHPCFSRYVDIMAVLGFLSLFIEACLGEIPCFGDDRAFASSCTQCFSASGTAPRCAARTS